MVAVYPYEEGEVYDGGHLDGLLALLHETRHAGIACRNIHPDNLLVTSYGLKFVDYGSDIVPWDESEFEQMCRRAYLTYRFPFRSDLKRLMTESLTDASLPELTGLDQFRRAVNPRGLGRTCTTGLWRTSSPRIDPIPFWTTAAETGGWPRNSQSGEFTLPDTIRIHR